MSLTVVKAPMDRRRKYLVGFILLTIILAVTHPFVAGWITGWRTGWLIFFIWLVLLIPVALMSSFLLWDEFSKKYPSQILHPIVRSFFVLMCSLFSIYYIGIVGYIAHDVIIQPRSRSELIFPNNFTGNFVVLIDNQPKFSWHTAFKVYEYHVPIDGVVHVDEGWITRWMLFPDSYEKPRRHSTLVRFENSTPLVRGTYLMWNIENRKVVPREIGLFEYPDIPGIVGRVSSQEEIANMYQPPKRLHDFQEPDSIWWETLQLFADSARISPVTQESN